MQIKPEDFCRWLQGFAELNESVPTDSQWISIKEHLQKVFEKITPPVAPAKPEQTMKELSEFIDDMMHKESEKNRLPAPFRPYYPPTKIAPMPYDPMAPYCKATVSEKADTTLMGLPMDAFRPQITKTHNVAPH